MKNLLSLLCVSVLFAAGGSTGFAQSMHSGMQSAHSWMMMSAPKCSAGDPVVGVNMKTKMYMTHSQIKMKMAGMSKSKMHQMLMQNHVKMMCESKADSMGAKMMQPHS